MSTAALQGSSPLLGRSPLGSPHTDVIMRATLVLTNQAAVTILPPLLLLRSAAHSALRLGRELGCTDMGPAYNKVGASGHSHVKSSQVK